MDDAVQAHQDATLAELGEALARARDELAWTTTQLQSAQAAAAVAEERAAAAERELAAVRTSATWRVGRVLVGPIARLRGGRTS